MKKAPLFPSLLLLSFIFLLTTAGNFIPGKKSTVGYFYRDSLMRQSSGYKAAADSMQRNSEMMHQMLDMLSRELSEKTKAMNSPDTANWSTLIKRIKHDELEQFKTRVIDFTGNLLLDSVLLRQQLLSPLYAKIDTAAAVYGRANSFAAVIDRANQLQYDNWKKAGARFKNVHEALLLELNNR